MSAASKRQIIDAHHHLWDLDACHYPWLMARGVRRFFGDPTPIQKNYLVADLLEDASDYELQGSVHIQVGVAEGDELRETAWLQETGDNLGLPSVIVAYCALEKANAIEQVEKQKQYSRLRGLRQIVGRSSEEDASTGSAALLADQRWQENLAAIGELELSFDLQLIPQQVPRVAEVIAATPGTRFAICHCGSPWDQSEKGLAAWRDGMRLLASLPNTVCKISGLGMFDHDWSTTSIRPIVESCIELFGPQRSMFGSNFPVDKLHAGYLRVWQTFEEISAGLDSASKQNLFVETARKFYRM